MAESLRYGIFGIGRCGCVHAQILLDQHQSIVAIGDESGEAIEFAVRKLGLPPHVSRFNNPAEMAQSSGIEAVVISSHTKDHARDAASFIRAGLPVYLEKPLTAELSEAFSFVRSIGTDRNLLQIGLQRRFDPALVYAKELLDQKLIGDVREIRSVLRDQFPPPSTYSSRGLIIDMGIHVADEAHWLTGEFPSRVWAKMFDAKGYKSPINEGGNTAHVGFVTPSGIIGRLDLSRTHAAGYNNETSIIGTSGILHIGHFSGYPGPIPVELWTSEGKLHRSSKTFQMTHVSGDRAEFQPRFQTAYEIAHAEFRRAVAAKQNFRVTQNEVLDAQVIVEGAHRSALAGGAEIALQKSNDLDEYESLCKSNQLL